MGVPDLKLYYTAQNLNRLIDWNRNGATKQWVNLEKDLVKMNLEMSPWWGNTPGLEIKSYPTIRTTIEVCRGAVNELGLAPYPSPIYNLARNPDFPPSRSDRLFMEKMGKELGAIETFIEDERWKTPYEMERNQEIKTWGLFQINQISSFLLTLPPAKEFKRNKMEIEEEWLKREGPRHRLSRLYEKILSEGSDDTYHFLTKWEDELDN